MEGSKTCLDRLRRNTENIGNCDCRKCVIYVVLTADCKSEMCNILSVFYDIERGIALFVISNIGCTVIQGSFFAKSDNTAGKIGGDLFNFINISVDDESSVFRKKLSKKVERITGFSSLYTNDFGKEELKYYFPEFDQYQGGCRFQGCNHISEPGCLVKEALEEGKVHPVRYEDYCEMYRELEQKEKRRY